MGQSGSASAHAVNAVFREPVHYVLKKINNEPIFKWPNKMTGNPMRHNQNLYCQYHQDQGHTTEDCRNLWDHLDHLVQEGKLKHLLHHSSGQGSQIEQEPRRDAPSRHPLGTINVIFVASRRTGLCPSKVMFIIRQLAEDSNFEPKRAKGNTRPTLSVLDEDKVGTIQPTTMPWW